MGVLVPRPSLRGGCQELPGEGTSAEVASKARESLPGAEEAGTPLEVGVEGEAGPSWDWVF